MKQSCTSKGFNFGPDKQVIEWKINFTAIFLLKPFYYNYQKEK